MDPRVARSRARIMDATIASVLEHGVEGTSVDDICQRSGVARTTVYRHWDTKPELVLEALSASLEPPRDPDTGSLRDDLVALLGGFADGLTRGPLARLLATMVEAATRDERFADLHTREVAARHGIVATVIERGIARGELGADVDVDWLVAVLMGPVVYRSLVARQAVPDAFVESVVNDALAGRGGAS